MVMVVFIWHCAFRDGVPLCFGGWVLKDFHGIAAACAKISHCCNLYVYGGAGIIGDMIRNFATPARRWWYTFGGAQFEVFVCGANLGARPV